jgi:hypothetical protein
MWRCIHSNRKSLALATFSALTEKRGDFGRNYSLGTITHQLFLFLLHLPNSTLLVAVIPVYFPCSVKK